MERNDIDNIVILFIVHCSARKMEHDVAYCIVREPVAQTDVFNKHAQGYLVK